MNIDGSTPQGDDELFDFEKVETQAHDSGNATPASTDAFEAFEAFDVPIDPVGTTKDLTEQAMKEPRAAGDLPPHVIELTDINPTVALISPQEVKVKIKPAQPRIINLPNARSGEPYDEILELDDFEQLVDIKIEHIDGLHFSTETLVVRGTPTSAGEYKVTLKAIVDGQQQVIEARVTVIPDPKSLWKNIPSDHEGKFWKPDEECKSVRGELFLVGASKRGRSHAHVGSFRDDDFGLLHVQSSGWHIGIAADGGGSSKYSRRASQKVVEFINQNLPKLLEEKFSSGFDDLVKGIKSGKEDAIRTVNTNLYKSILTVSFEAARMLENLVKDLESAKEKGPDGHPLTYTIKDFNTTLILCVAKKSKHGWFIGTFSIGDGGAVVLDLKHKSVKLMTTGDSGEFAGQTRFLATSEFADATKAKARLHHYVSDSFDSIVLMTDGITDPFFPTDIELQDFKLWTDFWNNNLGAGVTLKVTSDETQLQLLSWLDFWSPGNHDDRTIVLLRNPGGR